MRPHRTFLLFRQRRRLLVNAATGVIVLLVAAVLWNWRGSGMAPPAPANSGSERTTTPSGASAGLYRAGQALGNGKSPLAIPEPPRTQPAALPPDPAVLEAEVSRGMADWRVAIRDRNADVVEAMDRTFAERPSDFIPALMVSAETDSDERVRAFSTRVLGKLRSAESSALMVRLLTDASEYVRFNAAWALGELRNREAVAGLRRLGKRDRSPMVRQAANQSLERIVGG